MRFCLIPLSAPATTPAWIRQNPGPATVLIRRKSAHTRSRNPPTRHRGEMRKTRTAAQREAVRLIPVLVKRSQTPEEGLPPPREETPMTRWTMADLEFTEIGMTCLRQSARDYSHARRRRQLATIG